MSEENNSDEIPVEVISDEKIETNNSEEESKHTDNLEQISDDPIKLLELEKQKVSQSEEKLKHVLADFQNLSRKTQSDIEHGVNSKIDELKSNLTTLNESVKLLDIDKQELDTKISESTDAFETTRSEASALKHEIEYLKRKVELYKSGKCPTCETQLDSQWHLDQKDHFCAKIETDTENIKTLKETLDGIKSNIETLRGEKRDIEKKTSDIKYNMKSFKAELLKIKDAPNDSQFTHLKNLIKDFEAKESVKTDNKNTLNADYAFMEIVERVLGEDGVKNLAVKTILPGLNSNIAAMAQTMHLQFHIRFDEKFNCIINHLGEDINPMTLSTGERKKADFIIIIAIIKILKLRFPQLNLLFLDELLSSVDHDGVYNILKILNQVIKENKINTFVINHSVLPHEIFDKKLQIYRENGFSKFTIETID